MYNDHIPNLIDHSNKNKLDNRIANLIHKSCGQNSHNKTKSKNTSSKYMVFIITRIQKMAIWYM